MKIAFTRKGLPEQSVNDLESSNNLKIVLICSGSFYLYHKKRKQIFHVREMLVIPLGINFHILPKPSNLIKPKIACLQLSLLNFRSRFSQSMDSAGLNLEITSIKLQIRDFIFLKKLLRWAYHYLKYHVPNDSYHTQTGSVEELIIKTIHKIIHQKTSNPVPFNTHKSSIALKFLQALEKNYTTEHKVNFYASLLCISEGYLNKILKETTLKSTKQNIDEYLIIQAKKLLIHKNWTVHQVSHELGFTCPSHFSNFFLKHQKTRPSLFIKELRKENL